MKSTVSLRVNMSEDVLSDEQVNELLGLLCPGDTVVPRHGESVTVNHIDYTGKIVKVARMTKSGNFVSGVIGTSYLATKVVRVSRSITDKDGVRNFHVVWTRSGGNQFAPSSKAPWQLAPVKHIRSVEKILASSDRSRTEVRTPVNSSEPNYEERIARLEREVQLLQRTISKWTKLTRQKGE